MSKYPYGFRSPLDKSPASNVPDPHEDVSKWACPPSMNIWILVEYSNGEQRVVGMHDDLEKAKRDVENAIQLFDEAYQNWEHTLARWIEGGTLVRMTYKEEPTIDQFYHGPMAEGCEVLIWDGDDEWYLDDGWHCHRKGEPC